MLQNIHIILTLIPFKNIVLYKISIKNMKLVQLLKWFRFIL
jgi:hypothetical protein